MPGADHPVTTVRITSSRRTAGGEVPRPRFDLGVLPDELAALTFGHAAPHAELNPVVERVGKALGDDGALATYLGCSALRRATDEEFVRICGSTQSFGDPGEAAFRWGHGYLRHGDIL